MGTDAVTTDHLTAFAEEATARRVTRGPSRVSPNSARVSAVARVDQLAHCRANADRTVRIV